MMKRHTLEFWPYLSGLAPRDITTSQKKILYCIERKPSFPNIQRGDCYLPWSKMHDIQEDVERTWKQGIAANPSMTNVLKPSIQGISADGKTIQTAFGTSQTSFWIKRRLSSYSPLVQESIGDQFPFLNIGIVTVTADDQILLEQRPLNTTAGGMLLNYPCSYLNLAERTLEESIRAQAGAEIGVHILVSNAPEGVIRDITSLGIQRESNGWTPHYTFLMKLTVSAAEIRAAKKTKQITHAPADPEQLIAYIAERYSPTITGDAAQRLVPNATGMLASYLRSVGGERAYENLVDRLTETAKTLGYALRTVDYTAEKNRFC